MSGFLIVLHVVQVLAAVGLAAAVLLTIAAAVETWTSLHTRPRHRLRRS